MNKMDLQRQNRARRYEDGDCVACGREERGDGVLCAGCRERNNSRRRKPGNPGWPKGKPRHRSMTVPMYRRAA